MRRCNHWGAVCQVSAILLWTATGHAAETGGVVVRFEKYDGPAIVEAQSLAKHQLRIDVDPQTETKELLIRVELPDTGREAWPVADVEVRDDRGEAVVVRRSGIEWETLRIPVPARRGHYIVQDVAPPNGGPRGTTPAERQFTEPKTGVRLAVAHWYDGRQAALSVRFDDSHTTHVTTVDPILREYGFRGTFMINPGTDEPGSRRRSSYQRHLADWEAIAKAGVHEFANHSAHHRGATGDEDMEAEVGDAARAIWKLTPGRSKLTALNLGGGTQWSTSRTLRYYLDKYHHFDASGGSLGMDDSYGNRVAAFRQHLERHIGFRGWCRIHFHAIGEGLGSSEANFRAALDVAQEHAAALWIAGMADIYKYQSERNSCSLSLVDGNAERLQFKLDCATDPELYDQALTIEVTPPKSWPADRVRVSDSQGEPISVRATTIDGQTVLRFDVPPRTAGYVIERH